MLALIKKVVLAKKMIPTVIPVQVRDKVVKSKSAVKYLGMMFNPKLSFFSRLGVCVDKMAKGVMELGRLMAQVK